MCPGRKELEESCQSSNNWVSLTSLVGFVKKRLKVLLNTDRLDPVTTTRSIRGGYAQKIEDS
jgi:hypothetical protein